MQNLIKQLKDFVEKNRLLIISIFSVFIIILGFSYNQYHIILNEQNEVKKTLSNLTHNTQNTIRIWAKDIIASAKVIANNPYFIQNVNLLHENSSLSLKERVNSFLDPIIEEKNYFAYFILDKNNNILTSNLKKITLKFHKINSGQNFIEALKSQKAIMSLPTKLSSATSIQDSGAVIFISVPIQNTQKEMLGSLLLCFDPKTDFLSFFNQARFGRTGETYAFHSDGLLLSESRFNDYLRKTNRLEKNQQAFLNLKLNNPSNQDEFKNRVDNAIKGINNFSLEGYRGYRGNYVIGAWVWDPVLDFGIVSEIERSEAYQLLYQNTLIYSVTAIFSIVLLMGIILLFLNNRREIIAVNESLEIKIAQRTQELSRKNSLLENLALIDALTEIPNRRQFDKRLIEEFKRGSRSETPLTLIMIDIDYFKKINDTKGHTYGDQCLQKVAKALKSVLHRETDFVARFGGEEFVYLLPNTDLTSGKLIAQMVMDNLASLKIPSPGSPISNYITISQGIATLVPNTKSNPKALIEMADKKLYLAKNSGRNQYCV